MASASEFVKEAITEFNQINSSDIGQTSDTRLYGGEEGLDSIDLVAIIVGIEDRVAEHLDKDIVIADDRAMSMANSPFATVGALISYVDMLINE